MQSQINNEPKGSSGNSALLAPLSLLESFLFSSILRSFLSFLANSFLSLLLRWRCCIEKENHMYHVVCLCVRFCLCPHKRIAQTVPYGMHGHVYTDTQRLKLCKHLISFISVHAPHTRMPCMCILFCFVIARVHVLFVIAFAKPVFARQYCTYGASVRPLVVSAS